MPTGAAAEREALRHYIDDTLRAPQVAADAILGAIFLADAGNRALMAAAVAAHLAGAARRFTAVYSALAERAVPVAQRLEGPLPGAGEWEILADHLEGMTASAILAELRLDESAAESAEALSAHAGELARYTTLIRVHEAEPPRLRRERGEPGSPGWLRFIGRARDGEPVEERLPLTEEAVVALADAVGELVTLSRDFLGAYAEARPQE